MSTTTTYHVKCTFHIQSFSGVIEGLEGIEDLELCFDRCGYKDIKILSY